MAVSITKATGSCREQVDRLLEPIHAGDLIRPGVSVLIKPNLHAPQHVSTGGTSNPEMVAALVRWCKDRGAGRVVVADGPYYGMAKPEEIFTKTGMGTAVEGAGAEWGVIHGYGYRLFDHASEHLPPQIGISNLVFDCDVMIDLAVMKTHIDALATLGLKNLKGCIRPDDKRDFHRAEDINRALVELAKLAHPKPDLTIVDGTLGMEGLGPASGDVVHFGHLFAGRVLVEVETVVSSAMGIEVEESRLLRFAREAGLGCMELGRIGVIGADLDKIRRRFERPDEANAKKFPEIELCSEGACSGCKLLVFRALREGRRGPVTRASIVIGPKSVPKADSILVGKCTIPRRDAHPFLPGCPPRLQKVKEFFEQLGLLTKG